MHPLLPEGRLSKLVVVLEPRNKIRYDERYIPFLPVPIRVLVLFSFEMLSSFITYSLLSVSCFPLLNFPLLVVLLFSENWAWTLRSYPSNFAPRSPVWLDVRYALHPMHLSAFLVASDYPLVIHHLLSVVAAQIALAANMFPIQFNSQALVYHYDLDVKPEIKLKKVMRGLFEVFHLFVAIFACALSQMTSTPAFLLREATSPIIVVSLFASESYRGSQDEASVCCARRLEKHVLGKNFNV